MKNLTTIIPAGGEGTRLRPHSFSVPKPLMHMGSGDRRVIDMPLDVCSDVSARILVTTDYKAEQVEAYVGGRQKVRTLRDSRTVGSAGSLIEHCVEVCDADSEGNTLILPSDHVYSGFDVADFHDFHRATSAEITALTVPPKDYGEYVQVDGSAITSVVRTPENSETQSTTGIFIIRNKFLRDWLQQRSAGWRGEPYNIYGDIVTPALSAGFGAVYGPHTVNYWDDAGTTERYHQNNMRLSSTLNVVASTAEVHPLAQLERCVILGHAVIGQEVQASDAVLSMYQGRLQITQAQARPAVSV